jgi:ABC-2 type transport system ATP-binding protein
MLDEPVNGLDPEGIQWIRGLLRGLAAEGRTLFVSSHLMSEMSMTADHLIVIGRGRLIADTGVAEFIASASKKLLRVRAPDAPGLRALVDRLGGAAEEQEDGSFEVSGVTAADLGDAAASAGVALHELTPHTASLEEAFMELTRGELEFGHEQEAALA